VTRSLDQSGAAILLDIEGTATPIDFVYKVLFPYAQSHVAEFLHRQGESAEVHQDLDGLCEQHTDDLRRGLNPPALLSSSDTASAVPYIHWLIETDRKLTPLKSLQGKIWEEGYARGELRSQVFDDVPPALKRWREQGRGVHIFSSGSVLAQRLLFAHTQVGDLTGYISDYFDTTIGSKTEPASYKKIANSLRLPARDIVFISDVTRELDAAEDAGFETLLSERPGNHPQPAHGYRVIQNFDDFFPD
jgi:enolase-phosphatase E1